ncbi:carbonic anhydrase [Parasphingopyxis lamellibrachiae]|uniref:Carbonic anhydrase n=1 Tax=Parasphingopyxis lamellibrachiae TaxID=680125 RepID=A0A3D9FDC9_9SPHN|nr:carbonic anhydrase [Parasphingopyxis lamellibrachiae]RED15567.1 carbonic anhydrase [Parasphingopyxis lamellibrachiae]
MTRFADLVRGYHRFRKNGWTAQRERWAELSHGQSPKVMIIACSDSRVDPAQIFDVSPGEIFVVRNVAALVPPYETGGGYHGVSAALEFAVTQLEVEEVVVMGHGLCGGCQAALSASFAGTQPGHGGFIADWIGLLDKAREAVVHNHGTEGEEALHAMEHEAVKTSLSNLRSFPFVAEREADNRLALRGSWFAISSGKLHLLDETNGDFQPA